MRLGPARVDLELRGIPTPPAGAVSQDGRRVDMTLDEMATQAVAHFEGPLEVDAVARLPVAQVGSGQGFRAGLDLEYRCPRPRRP